MEEYDSYHFKFRFFFCKVINGHKLKKKKIKFLQGMKSNTLLSTALISSNFDMIDKIICFVYDEIQTVLEGGVNDMLSWPLVMLTDWILWLYRKH